MNILYILLKVILSIGTILILIHNEEVYQAHKHSLPTNKIRYLLSQILILILYTLLLISLSHLYRYLTIHL